MIITILNPETKQLEKHDIPEYRYNYKKPETCIYAVKRLSKLSDEDKRYRVRDSIYTLKADAPPQYSPKEIWETYLFRCTTSPYSDNSGLNDGISGVHINIGSAIKAAQERGYDVYIGSIDDENNLVKPLN